MHVSWCYQYIDKRLSLSTSTLIISNVNSLVVRFIIASRHDRAVHHLWLAIPHKLCKYIMMSPFVCDGVDNINSKYFSSESSYRFFMIKFQWLLLLNRSMSLRVKETAVSHNVLFPIISECLTFNLGPALLKRYEIVKLFSKHRNGNIISWMSRHWLFWKLETFLTCPDAASDETFKLQAWMRPCAHNSKIIELNKISYLDISHNPLA